MFPGSSEGAAIEADGTDSKDASAATARESEVAERVASAVGRLVILLMRSADHQKVSLADLRWLVVPPVLSGQFSFASRRRDDGGVVVPVAAVLWARVSAEVDARLRADPSKPITLTAAEWTSGEIIWLVEAVGEDAVIKQMLDRLTAGAWKSKTVRLRVKTNEGMAVRTLSTAAA